MLSYVVYEQIIVLALVYEASAEVITGCQRAGEPLTKERISHSGAFEVDKVQH
jgi:hypothetical protein